MSESPVAKLESHLTVEQVDSDPLSLLAADSGLSKQRIKLCMQRGAVWLTRGRQTQRLRRAKKALRAGDQLHLYYDARVLDAEVAGPTLIADEGEYSVWYKPCGLMSQGSKWGDHGTVVRQAELLLQPQRPGFIVHRLDRATTGLILVAHSKTAVRALTSLFEQRALEKRYLALAHGHVSGEMLRLTAPIDERPAASQLTGLGYDAELDLSLVEVLIETGRKHQIRRHLAGAGHPILGDRLHGDRALDERRQPGCDLQLCAYSLSFVCPLTGVQRHYQVPHEQRPCLLDERAKPGS